jgi:hypothetical protein
MSIIETLTEGIVNRNLQQEGDALLNKWTATGLLEGLDESKKSTMAVLLENQAKSLLKESSSMSAGDVEGFAAVAFPIVRRVFAGLIANDLVSVQPMSLPSGLIFFLDFVYSPSLGTGSDALNDRLGNRTDTSIYGTDKVGAEIISGVNLLDTNKGDLSGPGRGGMTGYAFASPTGSNGTITPAADTIVINSVIDLSSTLTDAQKKLLNYDPDLLGLSSGAVIVVDVAEDQFPNLDFENMSAFSILDLAQQADTTGFMADIAAHSSISNTNTAAEAQQVRRLTKRVSSNSLGAPHQSALTSQEAAVRFFIVGNQSEVSSAPGTHTSIASIPANSFQYPLRDNIPAGGSVGSVQSTATNYALEGNTNIPEIDIKVDSTAITAQTKKLKAKWTPELGQDLNAYHNIDAEVELTSILSEQIALEIDREILADLVNGATAATYYWSRSPGLFVNRETGAEIGASSAAPDFTGTVSEWYETLIETVNDVSAQIHRKTLRGGATHVVCSPEVANILEFTAGFRANVTADADRGDIGATKVGSLNRKFDVIVDPYFPRNVLLVARIGSSFLESGYVYAPYVPLQTTPTIFGTEDFVPRKGVMTRYAKKMVRPDMYGLVICRDLLGGEYSAT